MTSFLQDNGLQKLGLLLSGIASTTSRDPNYLRTNLAMQDAFQSMRDREEAERAAKEQDQLLMRLMSPQIGTPATKSFQVNGRTIGQDAPAQMSHVLPDMQMRALQQAAPRAFNAAAVQKLLSERFPDPSKPMVVGKDQRVIDPNTNKTLVDIVPDSEPSDLSKEFKRMFGSDVPAGYRPLVEGGKMTGAVVPLAGFKSDQDAASAAVEFKKMFGSDVPSGYTPERGPDGKMTGSLKPLGGGPASLGNKGLPQAYKEQTAAMDTMGTILNNFETKYKETGGEVFPTGDAGDLDSMYTQLLFGMKGLEQTGALDRGSVEVMEKMIAKPTGMGGMLPKNYVLNQIASVRNYLKTKRADIDKAYQANPPEGAQAPAATKSSGATGTWENGQTRMVGGAKVTKVGP